MTIGSVVGMLVMSTSAISASNTTALKFDADSLSSTISNSTLDISALTSRLLSENSDNLEQVMTLLLQLKPESAQLILTEAMSDYPTYAVQFAALARMVGISSEVVTLAAVEAGVDPTQIAEQTAAGPEATPTPIAPSTKAPVSRS